MQPIVQIVHYSDLHLAGPEHLAQRRRAQQVQPLLPRGWQQGLAGADLEVLKQFEEFLRALPRLDPDWQALPLWLVDTGDGTTFGDQASLHQWLQEYTPKFLAAAGSMACAGSC